MINIDIFDGGRIVTYGTAVADSVLFEKIHFNFPAEWDGFAKTAVFTNGETKISVVLNENGKLCTGENECCIPHEVIKAPAFTVSVFGVSGDKRATTQIAQVSVKPSGYGEGATPAEPTPTEYEQLVAIANSAEQLAQSVRSDADSGAFKGDKGEQGNKGDKGDTGAVGAKGEKGDKGDPGKDAVADRAYSPTSENAQSGKAVAEALKAERTYANNSFSGALRGSASGEAVRLTDVSPLEHTLTVKLKSKNLLPFPYFHSSMTNQAGIAYTVNSDGTITANGTATGRSEFVLSANKSDWASGNYVLSGCPSGGSADTYSLQTINGFSDTGSGLQKNDTAEFARISIIIKKGTTVSNLVFKPQLELGTTPTAYTPYISDLTSVNVTRYGKNLTTPQQVYKGALEYSEEIFENKNCVRFTSAITIKNSPNAFKPKTQYTVSFDVKTVLRSGQTTSGADAVFCFFYDDDTLSTIYNTYTQPDWEHKVFTSTVDKTVVAVGLTSREYRSYSYVDINSFQLEESSTVTLCEPYQAQKYIPSADGTVSGVKSLYPITTLMTDTAGVIINAEYNRDINKAFAELQQAIISLGGNI